jgi:hypothetical protein
MPDESSPLLQFPGMNGGSSDNLGDRYQQFCHLVGLRPSNLPKGAEWKANPDSLYQRAIRHRRNQGGTYVFTAALTNSLLLSQVVLGAALTALGASDASRVLVTVFGAMNTVIAGLIAFLKSRGQPVRARMFRDDLERVVDEIENSAVMWLGISRGAHGYDAIDPDEVTVRSEVARLTRLYDRAVKSSTANDPDNYAAGTPGDPYSAALRSRTGQPGPPGPAPLPAPAPASSSAPAAGPDPTPAPAPAPAPTSASDPDESPASKAPEPPKPKDTDPPKAEPPKVDPPKEDDRAAKTDETPPAKPDAAKAEPAKPDDSKPTDSKVSLPADAAAGAESSPAQSNAEPGSAETDREPATAAKPEKHSEDTSKPEDDKK